MKRIVLSGLLALSLFGSSCSNQDTPVTFEKFYPLDDQCQVDTFSELAVSPNGYLDIAWGNPVFRIAFLLTGAELVTQPPLVQGENTLESENRDKPVIQQAVIAYRTSRPLGVTLKPHVISYTAPLNGPLRGQVQLISPELAAALDATLTATNDMSDVVDLQIDVHFEGKMSSSNAPFSTATLNYPIRAYRSAPPAAFTCPNGTRRFRTDPLTGVSCLYIGQSYSQNSVPERPYDTTTHCCDTAGAPEC